MLLRLGINTCFAVKRWPQPDDWAPIAADRFGLRLVQHSLDLVDLTRTTEHDERQAAAILAAASAAGLDVASTFTGLAAYSANLLLDPDPATREAARAWYERVIAFTARLGATATGGHVGAMSVSDWTDPTRRAERWHDLQASLRALARQASAAGLGTILVENLAAAREPSTMAMIRDLISPATTGQAAIALCLDVGHMCVPGTSGDDRDPYAWLRQFGPTTPIIQLQQSDADGDHHWPFTPARNSEGRIEADRVIDALAEGGTDRSDLIIEVIPAFEQEDRDVLDDLEATVDYWREALGRRGVLAET
jgi:sugar phosphate isomerase/epimerase